jgi:hypothetical protein
VEAAKLRSFFRFLRGGAAEQEVRWQDREEQGSGCRLRIDLTSQVIRLDVPERQDYLRGIGLVPYLGAREGRWRATFCNPEFTSAAMLGRKAKQFDDGLVAAIVLGMQKGLLSTVRKPQFLKEMVVELVRQAPITGDGALPLLMAAGELGGAGIDVPQGWRAKVDRVLGDFLADPNRSKPLGFYTWSDALTSVFRQDRILQTAMTGEESAALVSVLKRRPDLQKQYEALLALGERLTNHYEFADLRELVKSNRAASREPAGLFPPCASPEVSLLQRLYLAPKTVPEGFALMEEVIRHIRSGELSLAPQQNSGWYEYQLWSLEPLVIPEQTPEAEHLRFEVAYKDHLVELFKGMYALARETHLKDLAIPPMLAGMPQDPPIYISPKLTVEPLATSYRRRALGYRFLHDSLDALLGEGALQQLNRERAEGTAPVHLAEELTQMEALFWGAYLASMQELGLPASMEPSSTGSGLTDESCLQHFRSWQERMVDDEDVSQDSRMMVPVFFDEARKQMKVWAFLGWRETWIEASFVSNPKVAVLGARRANPKLRFGSSTFRAYHPVTAEVYVSELMDRKQFRAHCDKHRTEEAILKHLAADGAGADTST